jgi:hypothetical protein
MPHNEPGIPLFEKIMEEKDMLFNQIFQRIFAALKTASGIMGFITTDMEKRRIIKEIMKFRHQISKNFP